MAAPVSERLQYVEVSERLQREESADDFKPCRFPWHSLGRAIPPLLAAHGHLITCDGGVVEIVNIGDTDHRPQRT